jgi:small-conductance mechanosensitive channel
MHEYKTQILETLVIFVLYITTYFITKIVINNALKNTHLQRGRRKTIVKAVQLITSITALILIAAVWGLKQNQIAVFASTIITALGIAFFAQWSLLSNITSSILLFFNHPVKLGDNISVMDKDNPFEGEVIELTYFFVHLKTKTGEIVTVPNSILMVKPVSIVSNVTE